jgi:hypothetical protein
MLFKLICWVFLVDSAFSIPDRQLQLGSQLDDHGCVKDGGYQWCESTNSCIRPWTTPCLSKTKHCSNSSPQLCRMMCPPFSCEPNQCAQRIRNCCDYKCVDNKKIITDNLEIPYGCVEWFDGCNTCSVTNGLIGLCTLKLCSIKHQPKCIVFSSKHRRLQTNTLQQFPDGCTQWFDGCNTCHRQGPTDPFSCTMMMCFQRGTPNCLSYSPGYTNRPVINVSPNFGRCASGFCENPNDCPRCQSGYICRPAQSICAGTCYGTCQYNGHRRLNTNTCNHNKDCRDTHYCNSFYKHDGKIVGYCKKYKIYNEICRNSTKSYKCKSGLECIYKKPYILDIGVCKNICKNKLRDNYDNCIEDMCDRWFDGCNVCLVGRKTFTCSTKFCRNPDKPFCLTKVSITSPQLKSTL